MDHRQISEFVNSKDVRRYLQDTGYEFSTPQAAWLVHECKRLTMEERHKAWREIIRDMPDCAMEERRGIKRIDSFHAFLNDFIAMKERHMSEFMDNTGCIYSFEYCLKDTPPWDDGGRAIDDFFSNVQACIESYQQYLKEYEVDENSIDEILIIKYRLDLPEPVIIHRAGCLRLNAALEVKNVYMFHKHDEDLAEAFEGMCFDFPTPFWRGDILVDRIAWGEPFVLSHITTWNSEEMLSSGFSEDDCPDPEGWAHFDQAAERILKNGRRWEAHAIGTHVSEDIGFCDTCLISIPTNLEYFREPLEGMARQLKVLSLYEKGELDGTELANLCSDIRLNEYTKKVCRIYTDGRRYTDEFLERIGLRPPQ